MAMSSSLLSCCRRGHMPVPTAKKGSNSSRSAKPVVGHLKLRGLSPPNPLEDVRVTDYLWPPSVCFLKNCWPIGRRLPYLTQEKCSSENCLAGSLIPGRSSKTLSGWPLLLFSSLDILLR